MEHLAGRQFDERIIDVTRVDPQPTPIIQASVHALNGTSVAFVQAGIRGSSVYLAAGGASYGLTEAEAYAHAILAIVKGE